MITSWKHYFHFDVVPHIDCVHLSCGGRYWYYEYYVGVSD